MSETALFSAAISTDAAYPSCAEECLWYEDNGEDGACMNRHNLICAKHREEIFGHDS